MQSRSIGKIVRIGAVSTSLFVGPIASSFGQSLTWLGTLGGNASAAFDVSADGTVVVGWAHNSAEQRRAFRWCHQCGIQNLGTLGGEESAAYGVSSNRNVVAGWSVIFDEYGIIHDKAFRWENRVMRDITPQGYEAWARGISADGNVIVGTIVTVTGRRNAFRWVAGVGMRNLGTLGGPGSHAMVASASGDLVVGSAQNASNQPCAFRWKVSGGMEDLNSTYASLLTDGSRLGEAAAISIDGRYIVGRGYNAQTQRTEAYLLDTWCNPADVNNDGTIDDADLLAILTSFGSPGTGYTRHEDINKDGVVDDADLLLVLSNFGNGC